MGPVLRFATKPADPDAAARLVRELGIHPVTAQVLASRGFAEPAAARRFLHAGTELLREPETLPDLPEAAALLAEAVHAGQRIAVYGDYDVDGVCGTAILVRALRALGAEVVPFIPHRVQDGYGLNLASLERLRAEGCQVVVTVDNGSTRAAEIAAAQAQGLRIVVTDHHEVVPPAPPCLVVNPKRSDRPYPFPGLAGCGVAWKLAMALLRRAARMEKDLVAELMALAAIGTVADVVPLLDENRAIVALGLRALAATKRPGLRALLEVAECARRPVSAVDIAFRIGPRINAAGRVGSAGLALDTLLEEDASKAAKLARALDEGNRERQRIERTHSGQAFAEAERLVAAGTPAALVLASAEWHPGVIGIVAARVAETFRRPAALICIEGESARGSARSFGGVRLHEALEACSEHLLTHGGHAFAAGFTMRAGRIDDFRGAFVRAVGAQAPGAAGPALVDAELPLEAITPSLVSEIASLAPFGTDNPEPVFHARGLSLAGRPQRMGAEERHLAFHARSGRACYRAVAFHRAGEEDSLRGRFDLSFTLRPREGPEAAELHVREIVPGQ
jgi:single-stranded-DNA-specific exonuclease